MRVAIYGTGKTASIILDKLRLSNALEVQIVYFVKSERTEEYYHGIKVLTALEFSPDEFDYLVIASFGRTYEEIISYLVTNRNDFDRLEKKIVSPMHFIEIIRLENPQYSIVNLPDGIKYMYSEKDCYIGGYMHIFGENFAKTQIDDFFELTRKYYGKRDRKTVFLDIGANIGTTSIYVKSKHPELSIYGIEAGRDNYDLFKINCILNHVEDIHVFRKAISDRCGEAYFYYNEINPGGSWIEDSNDEGGFEVIPQEDIDTFILHNSISFSDIGYVWMDVEGSEVNVLKGATRLLQEHIPMMQEFSPFTYEGRGLLDDYIGIIEDYYDSFIDYREFEQGNERCIKTKDMRYFVEDMMKSGRNQTDLFFI